MLNNNQQSSANLKLKLFLQLLKRLAKDSTSVDLQEVVIDQIVFFIYEYQN